MKKPLLFLLLLFPLMISCSDKGDTEAAPCKEDVYTVVMKVQDESQKPYALDSMKVFMHEKEISIIKDFSTENYKQFQQSGSYPLVSDDLASAYVGLFDEYPILLGNVKVIGYKKDKIAFEKVIGVMKDECHIFCDTKNLTITLN